MPSILDAAEEDFLFLLSEEQINQIVDEEVAKLEKSLNCNDTDEFQERLTKLENEVVQVNQSFGGTQKNLTAVGHSLNSFVKHAAKSVPENTKPFKPNYTLTARPYVPVADHDSDSEEDSRSEDNEEDQDEESDDSVAVVQSESPDSQQSRGASTRSVSAALTKSHFKLSAPPSSLPLLKQKDACFALFKYNKHFYPGEVVSVMYDQRKSSNQADAKPPALKRVTVKFLGRNKGISSHIRYSGPVGGSSAELDPKSVAFAEPVPWKLPVAARVIALYSEPNSIPPEGWCAGVVAELPSVRTHYRYLIFFDDGYVQYCDADKVLRMVASSADVCADMDCDDISREFHRDYFAKYPEKAMVRLVPNSYTKVESNGFWWKAKVLRLDCSLVQVEFLPSTADVATSHRKPIAETEWIYRGSTRLALLYLQLNSSANKAASSSGNRRTNAKSTFCQPSQSLEYVQLDHVFDDGANAEEEEDDNATVDKIEATVQKVIAKGDAVGTSALPSGTNLQDQRQHVTAKQEISVAVPHRQPRLYEIQRYHMNKPLRSPFVAHDLCTPECLSADNSVDDPEQCRANFDRYFNPLLVPILCGWQRETARFGSKRRQICYTAPCGRRLRNAEELCRYLFTLNSKLTIDLFCFDPIELFTFAQAVNIKARGHDYSLGRESLVRIPWSNSRDFKEPFQTNYCPRRKSFGQAVLNVDCGFASCCDCTDNCMDKTKCSCQQLTAKHANMVSEECRLQNKANVGYSLRRLKEKIISGIFECNSGCKCSQHACVNRVVQNPIHVRLENKGFGVRAVDDIPKGTFVSTYCGVVLSPKESESTNDGDEYFADLDFIESMENAMSAEDQEFLEAIALSKADALKKKKNADANGGDNDAVTKEEDDGRDREEDAGPRVKKAKLNEQVSDNGVVIQGEQRSLRMLYNETDKYVIDAKKMGNVGRYFNHSCSPNMFVQSVFVDTHDLRYVVHICCAELHTCLESFPWVGLFTSERVRAGTELCWDYSYAVNSIEGKRINCECGSSDCRGRLL